MKVIIWNTQERQWQKATEIDHRTRAVRFEGTLDVEAATPFTRDDVRHYELEHKEHLALFVRAGLPVPQEN